MHVDIHGHRRLLSGLEVALEDLVVLLAGFRCRRAGGRGDVTGHGKLIIDDVLVIVVAIDRQRDRHLLCRRAEQPDGMRVEVPAIVEDGVVGRLVVRRVVMLIGAHGVLLGFSRAIARRPGYPAGRMTTKRSPASTCAVAATASRSTTPSTGAVIAASIFIASIDATG